MLAKLFYHFTSISVVIFGGIAALYLGTHVPELYYGKAKDYAPQIPVEQHWHENFLAKLEKDFMLNRKCPLNNNEVWEEGIVIRPEKLEECEQFKLKNWAFLQAESSYLDKGIADIETTQSENEEVVDGDS